MPASTLAGSIASKDHFGVPTAALPFSGTVADSAAHTASADWAIDNLNATGLIVILDATVKGGAAPSVVFTVRGYDPTSGKTWDMLSSAAVTGVGTTVLRVSEHMAAVANKAANDLLPPVIIVHAEASNTDSLTYSVAAVLTA